MRFDVKHHTAYTYAGSVSVSHMAMRLRPRSTSRQRVERCRVTIDPAPEHLSEDEDFFGNPLIEATLERPHRALEIVADSRVEVVGPGPLDLSASSPWERARDWALGTHARDVAACFAHPSPLTRANRPIFEYARASFAPERPLWDAAAELMSRICAEFVYDPLATDAHTPVGRSFALRRGVCQDFAHVMLAGLRALGVPARYVSGYLLTHPPEGQERLVGADASHAWVSVYDPVSGWLDLDPTNDLLPGDEHVTLAFGRDFSDVSPIKGAVYGGGSSTLEVSVDVAPL